MKTPIWPPIWRSEAFRSGPMSKDLQDFGAHAEDLIRQQFGVVMLRGCDLERFHLFLARVYERGAMRAERAVDKRMHAIVQNRLGSTLSACAEVAQRSEEPE